METDKVDSHDLIYAQIIKCFVYIFFASERVILKHIFVGLSKVGLI